MEFSVEVDNEVVILRPKGNLVASTSEGLKAQVGKIQEKNFNHVALDMSQIGFIDSSGLGACIAINKILAGSYGALVCTGLNESVRKVFRITRADQKIVLADSRGAALQILFERIMKGGK